MAVAKRNFLAAHWDWIVAAAGFAAFAAAIAFLLPSLGTSPDDAASSFEASLAGQRPEHEGVAVANLDVLGKALRVVRKPILLQEVDSKASSFLSSERRIFCRQGDPDAKTKACGKPIPAGCETCPLCGAKQKVVKVEVDRDHDGIPDDWEKKFGLNPDATADAEEDSDNDGFSNIEEYRAGTNPKDGSSHPDYLDSLSVVGELRQTTLPFYFNGATRTRDSYRITFQRIGVTGYNAKFTPLLNEEIASSDGKVKTGWKVTEYAQKTESKAVKGSNVKKTVDVSTADIVRISDGKKLTLRVGQRNVTVESQVDLSYDRGKSSWKKTVTVGTEIDLNGAKYTVVKLNAVAQGCEVTLRDQKTKKEKTIR